MTACLSKAEGSDKKYIGDQIKNIALNAINNAPMLDAPFPCFTVDKLFSWNVYHQIISQLPSDNDYFRSKEGRTPNPYAIQSRSKISLSDPDQLTKIDSKKRLIWRELNDLFTSDDFMVCLFRKYAPFLKGRYGDLTHFDTSTRLELIRDKTGYRINPHTDAPHKIFTSLIYLPKDCLSIDLGTSIYEPEEKGFRCEIGGQYSPEDRRFNEVLRAPYQAGRMFSFMKTDNSFHGREPIEVSNVERNHMICTVQHKQTFVRS